MATTEKIPVTMADGFHRRVQQTSEALKTSTIDTDAGTVSVRLDFVNGEIRNCTIPTSLILRAAAHGAEQNSVMPLPVEADIADAILSVEEVIARLRAGDWNQPRAAGSNTGTSILIQALVRSFGRGCGRNQAFLENKTRRINWPSGAPTNSGRWSSVSRSGKGFPLEERRRYQRASRRTRPGFD